MNKYQEALDNYYKMNAKMLSFCPTSLTFTHDEMQVVDLIKELVDRATPKKPQIDKIYFSQEAPFKVLYIRGICTCGLEIWNHQTFCPYCGQSLEWEEGEKK